MVRKPFATTFWRIVGGSVEIRFDEAQNIIGVLIAIVQS
jgi:hypothetical protein